MRDDSSFNITHRSCCIALIGLSFAGAIGIGKKVQTVKLKVRVTKLFVTGCAGGLVVVVLAGRLAWEGAAALGGTMVERGDRTSIHVGLCRKAYQVENDFLFAIVPELKVDEHALVLIKNRLHHLMLHTIVV